SRAVAAAVQRRAASLRRAGAALELRQAVVVDRRVSARERDGALDAAGRFVRRGVGPHGGRNRALTSGAAGARELHHLELHLEDGLQERLALRFGGRRRLPAL